MEEQDQNRFQSCLLFFLALYFSLSRTYRKRLKTLELAKSHCKKLKKTLRVAASQRRSHVQRCNVVVSYNVVATRTIASQRRSLQRRSVQRRNVATWNAAASQQRELQRRNNTIYNDAAPQRCTLQHCCELQRRSAPSCNATFVTLSLAINVSRTPDSATIATELRGALQHHQQRFPSDFRPSGFHRTILRRWLLKSCLHHC